MQSQSLDTLCLKLGYRFHDPSLLARALIHQSLVHEGQADVSNERLEFLGDSVVGLVVADYLFHNYPDKPEGFLAQMKSYLVSGRHLAVCAQRLGLGEYLRIASGRGGGDGRITSSLLANGFEAVLGAIFLDGGFQRARQVVLKFLAKDMDRGLGATKDPKSRLQERLQTVFSTVPDYEVVSVEGPPHERVFEVNAVVANEILGSGRGPSKRAAGKVAAQQAISELKRRGDDWYKPYLGKLPLSHGHPKIAPGLVEDL